MRCFTSCEINGRTELVWSGYSQPTQHLCSRPEEAVREKRHAPSVGKPAWKLDLDFGSKQTGFIALVLVAALVLLLAFVLGAFLV